MGLLSHPWKHPLSWGSTFPGPRNTRIPRSRNAGWVGGQEDVGSVQGSACGGGSLPCASTVPASYRLQPGECQSTQMPTSSFHPLAFPHPPAGQLPNVGQWPLGSSTWLELMGFEPSCCSSGFPSCPSPPCSPGLCHQPGLALLWWGRDSES